jgi:hypothetical protein
MTKGILFSAPMVNAILEDRKTKTRRVIKIDPDVELELYGGAWRYYSTSRAEYVYVRPRYIAGDVLYVREAFAHEGIFWAYKADVRDDNTVGAQNLALTLAPTFYANTLKWKPSIHMPRAAARIFLRVTDVRAERLHYISETDAIYEGVIFGKGERRLTARIAFMDLWNAINAKRGYSWDKNPWVWAYTFERISAKEARRE